jgi:alpha-tubulin suppressor-like RCC1 family protein
MPNVGRIAAGFVHVCASSGVDNLIRCWGDNGDGGLGDGTLTTQSQPMTVVLPGANGSNVWISPSAGSEFSCGLDGANHAFCWGYNADGELGNGGTAAQSTAVAVLNATGVAKISSGYLHSCALTTGGTVACWGANDSGQLGNNNAATMNKAVVPAIDGVTDIAAGAFHTCAIKTSGTMPSSTTGVYCWGSNSAQQLGTTTAGNTLVPTLMSSGFPSQPVQIVAGREHTCVLLTGSAGAQVQCWGDDYNGELGDNMTDMGGATPVNVIGLTNATYLSARSRATCAVRYDGTAACWGQDLRGELGDGNVNNSSSNIVAVKNLTNVEYIERGDDFSCATKTDGTVWCWGTNDRGQLGQGTALQKAMLTPSLASCP